MTLQPWGVSAVDWRPSAENWLTALWHGPRTLTTSSERTKEKQMIGDFRTRNRPNSISILGQTEVVMEEDSCHLDLKTGWTGNATMSPPSRTDGADWFLEGCGEE